MKTIMLLRHAKSDWANTALNDHQRPLNLRGQQDAVTMGCWLAKQDLAIDLVLCSSAMRTRETWQHVSKQLPSKPSVVQMLDELYLAPFPVLLSQLQSALKTQQHVLLIAHNPGLDELLNFLSQQPPPLSKAGKLMTTANLAVLDCPQSELTLRSCQLRHFIRPKELA